MEVGKMEWYEIASLVIGMAGALFGAAFFARFRTITKVLKEVGELLTQSGELFGKASEALRDRKVTKAEAVLLLKEWQDVCQEFKDLYAALHDLIPTGIIAFLLRR